MGPLTEPRFDTFLQVRLTTHDKERIKARALEAGLNTSEYVRKRALGQPAEDLTPTPQERQRITKALLGVEAANGAPGTMQRVLNNRHLTHDDQ